ncbi:MAG: hypothetical protein JRH20_01845 [Deltaproteobacteria bacterium]|nr:hypothetical protein [Deltaproteobacteria bacterium]
MSDDRERRSWKDIDRMRDGSSRREPRSERYPRSQKGQKSYRAALDRAFNSGKIGALIKEQTEEEGTEKTPDDASRIKLLHAISTAEDRASITKAVDAYLEKYELPDDANVLAKAVHHRKAGIQLTAMQKLNALLDTEKPKRVRALVGQLKMIRDMADEREMEELADRLIDRLD